MSILTKTNRKGTFSEGTSIVSDKVSKGYQPQTWCCKQVSSSDKGKPRNRKVPRKESLHTSLIQGGLVAIGEYNHQGIAI